VPPMRTRGCAHVDPKFSRIDPKSYEDLLDLPVILILCEKGEMGDTFPKSFRHYDLRLRYSKSCEYRAAVEQDLGRAFRYGPATEDYPFPTILVGKQCAAELGRQKENLLRLDPDAKMRMWKETVAHPAEVKDSSATYRKYWICDDLATPHYDYVEHVEEYVNSISSGISRHWHEAGRFLFQGRPQIGKTGAFLHLIERLFYYVRPKAVVFPPAEEIIICRGWGENVAPTSPGEHHSRWSQASTPGHPGWAPMSRLCKPRHYRRGADAESV
jgi:hypothetical protein